MTSHTPRDRSEDPSRPLLPQTVDRPVESKPSRFSLFVAGALYLVLVLPTAVCGAGALMLFRQNLLCLAIASSIWLLCAALLIGAVVLLRQATRRADAAWKPTQTAIAMPFVGCAVIVVLSGIYMLFFPGAC